MSRFLSLGLAAGLCAGLAWAQNDTVTTAAAPATVESGAIPLYGDKTLGKTGSENWGIAKVPVIGDVYFVRNVTRPTLTPVLPKAGKATGAAVIIAPGGAFMLLGIDHEGWRVAHTLANRGIAAFVLKYRLLPTPVDNAESWQLITRKTNEGAADPTKMPPLRYPAATQDALAALAMVRSRAHEWGIDPHHVGMMGFSAGSMTSLNAVISASSGEGPDFIGYVYGPQASIEVPANAPPMFDAIALDDPLFPMTGFPIAQAWMRAGRPVEIHGYERGHHGFGGLGVPGTTTTLLVDEFVAWLDMHGFLSAGHGEGKASHSELSQQKLQ